MQIQVIEKTNGRINRVTGTTIKERLRVCAYCRVSTDNEEQLNSYQSQLKYYDEKINSKSEWQFAGIYADEAISGTLDFKRTNFMKMIQDSMEGKIDMILTKSISRFARNTLDTLKYVRMLKEKNVAILFEEEMIKLDNDFKDNYKGFCGDISDEEFITNTINEIKNMGNIKILINNAGEPSFKIPTEYTKEDIDKCFKGLQGMIIVYTQGIKS